MSLLLKEPNTTTTIINNDCGYGSYYDGIDCVVIPSSDKCEALFLYTIHDYAHIQLIWDSVQSPKNNTNLENFQEIRYIISYLSQYGTTDVIITHSTTHTITNSFINNDIDNYKSYYHKTIATIQTIFDYNIKTNQYPVSSISNISTNCILIIPSLTTPSPTKITTAILYFNGSFFFDESDSSKSKKNHIVLKYKNLSEIKNTLNHTYIIRDPFDLFEYDILLHIKYCYNKTNEQDAGDGYPQQYICHKYNDIFTTNMTQNVSLNILSIPSIHEFEAISLTMNCSLIYNDNNNNNNNNNINTANSFNCLIGYPQELTFMISNDNNDNSNPLSVWLTIWWFWVLLGLALLIISCILFLFGQMRKNKKLKEKLFLARNELHITQRDNDKLQPDMLKNPLGTGIPDSMPMIDPIEQELNERKQQQQDLRTYSFGNIPFEYKIRMKPNTEQANQIRKKRKKEDKQIHRLSDTTNTHYSNVKEMIELDAKGRKKMQVWKTSYEEPLLQ